jgi:hypothetical protein
VKHFAGFPSIDEDAAKHVIDELEDMFDAADLASKGKPRSLVWYVLLGIRNMLLVAREERLKLEWRIEELEQRPRLAHRGVWKRNSCYDEATLIQHGGNCWLSTKSGNNDEPGCTDAWTLVAKRGRDGRSVRIPAGEAA